MRIRDWSSDVCSSDLRTNGQNSIGLGIVRQSGANTLEVADRAKALAEEMSPTLPAGMTISVGSDESEFISRAIDKVYHTLAEAAVLVVLVIFLFLGSVRATFIPAITRSEEHTSELQSLMRISYAVFCLKKKR